MFYFSTIFASLLTIVHLILAPEISTTEGKTNTDIHTYIHTLLQLPKKGFSVTS